MPEKSGKHQHVLFVLERLPESKSLLQTISKDAILEIKFCFLCLRRLAVLCSKLTDSCLYIVTHFFSF